jgi:hypothetical protein
MSSLKRPLSDHEHEHEHEHGSRLRLLSPQSIVLLPNDSRV